jgi:transposase
VEKKLPEAFAQTLAQLPGKGPVRVLFQDEARFGLIADVRRCWCPKPFRPLVTARVSQEYTYAYAALCPFDGRLESLILPHVNGECLQIFLNEVAARYPDERLVMILDGAGWHRSGALRLPDNLRLLPLPPYSPELNPVEHLWDELREKYFHNRAFDSIDALEQQLETALVDYESEPNRVASIARWPRIVNALLN